MAQERRANEERLRAAERANEERLAAMKADLEAKMKADMEAQMQAFLARFQASAASAPLPPVAPSTAAPAEAAAGPAASTEAATGPAASAGAADGPAATAEAGAGPAATAEAGAGPAEAAEAAAEVEQEEAEIDPEPAAGGDEATKPGPRDDQDPEGGSGAAAPAAGGPGASDSAAGGGSGAAEPPAEPPSGGAGGGPDETMVDAGQDLEDTLPIENVSPMPGENMPITSLSSVDMGDVDHVSDSQDDQDRSPQHQAQDRYASPVPMASSVQALAAAPALSARRLRDSDPDAPAPPPAAAPSTVVPLIPHDTRVLSVRNTAVPAIFTVVRRSSSAEPASTTAVPVPSTAAPASTTAVPVPSTAAPAPTGPFSGVMEAVRRYRDPASIVRIQRMDSGQVNDLVAIPVEWKDKVTDARTEFYQKIDPFSQRLIELAEQGFELEGANKKEIKELRKKCYLAVCKKHQLPHNWIDWAEQLQSSNVIPSSDESNTTALLVRDVEKYLTNVKPYTPEQMQRRNREVKDAADYLLRRLNELAPASLPGSASAAAGAPSVTAGTPRTGNAAPGGRLGARAGGPSKAAGAAGAGRIIKEVGNRRPDSSKASPHIPKKVNKEAQALTVDKAHMGPKNPCSTPSEPRRTRVAIARVGAAALDPNA